MARWPNKSNPTPCQNSGVGQKRKVGCIATCVRAAGPAVCRHPRKARRKCRDEESGAGRSQRRLGVQARAQGCEVRFAGGVGRTMTPSSANAALSSAGEVLSLEGGGEVIGSPYHATRAISLQVSP